MSAQETREAPRKFSEVLRYLGPGLIVAAGLVGSGELIATTNAGAKAGIGLLWVIVLGCVIKVFVQVELARYAVSSNETTLRTLNRIPGPGWHLNWLVWLWLIMMMTTYGMLGGILGGVGQALSMAIPITGDYARLLTNDEAQAAQDPKYWASLVAVGTSLLLFFGRYKVLETVCVGLVLCFTVITVGNAMALQATGFAVPAADILKGLWFSWPDDPHVWLTALAAFGIIGVGGTDLIIYPYWCLERGYAAYIGSDSKNANWASRANAWIRVMKIDAFISLGIYTCTTVAFFFIGAAVLHAEGGSINGVQMIASLATAYLPVFGSYAKALLIAGALAVLYSSFLVANAGAARLFTDCLTITGLLRETPASQERSLAALSLLLPLACLLIFLTGWNPLRLIVLGGLVQSLVLPAIGFSALYMRFKLTDQRLRPGPLWDTALLLSCLSLLTVGLFSLYQIFGSI